MLAGRRCWSFEDVRVSSPIARSTPSPQPVSLACDTLPGPVSECPRHWCGGGRVPSRPAMVPSSSQSRLLQAHFLEGRSRDPSAHSWRWH